VPALLILGALAGAMQLLDAGIGLFEHDLGKCAGPLFIAVLQFFVVYLRIGAEEGRMLGPIRARGFLERVDQVGPVPIHAWQRSDDLLQSRGVSVP
jgi:hypothetical protein